MYFHLIHHSPHHQNPSFLSSNTILYISTHHHLYHHIPLYASSNLILNIIIHPPCCHTTHSYPSLSILHNISIFPICIHILVISNILHISKNWRCSASFHIVKRCLTRSALYYIMHFMQYIFLMYSILYFAKVDVHFLHSFLFWSLLLSKSSDSGVFFIVPHNETHE